MAKQLVNIGTSINKGDGDPLRTAFDKINQNFNELYASTTLDLDSIGSNMIPTTDGGFALGSATKQWTDLYVRDFIYIGGTRLQSDAAGNITVEGGSLQIKDVQGDIFADDSTKVFDSATQTFTGKFEGELIGTVAADDSTVLIDGVAGTINAGALTGNLPAIDGSALTGITASSIAFSNITSKPTTIAGYGITDAASLAAPAFTGAVDFTGTTSVDFTGATVNGLTVTETDPIVGAITGLVKADGAGNISAAVAGTDYSTFDGAFSSLTSKPTTVAGYGITDALTSGGNINLADDEKAIFGAGDDLQIWHNATNSIIQNSTGELQLRSNTVRLLNAATTKDFAYFNNNGSVDLYYDGTKKFSTSAGGIQIEEGVEEKFATLTGQVGTVDHDCNNGHVFYHTGATGAITANFTNLDLTAEYATNLTVIINQGATAYEVNAVQIGGAVQTIEWQGGSAPTGTANGIDSFSFTILNDGGSYVVLGQMVDFT